MKKFWIIFFLLVVVLFKACSTDYEPLLEEVKRIEASFDKPNVPMIKKWEGSMDSYKGVHLRQAYYTTASREEVVRFYETQLIEKGWLNHHNKHIYIDTSPEMDNGYGERCPEKDPDKQPDAACFSLETAEDCDYQMHCPAITSIGVRFCDVRLRMLVKESREMPLTYIYFLWLWRGGDDFPPEAFGCVDEAELLRRRPPELIKAEEEERERQRQARRDAQMQRVQEVLDFQEKQGRD